MAKSPKLNPDQVGGRQVQSPLRHTLDDAKSIEDTAKSIAPSGYLDYFMQSSLPQYHWGHVEQNLGLIERKTAELLLDLFQIISTNC